MKAVIYRPLSSVVVIILVLWCGQVCVAETSSCEPIQVALSGQNACHCFNSGVIDASPEYETDNSLFDTAHSKEPVWIGCSESDLPNIHRALDQVENETFIHKLWIWSSHMTIIPPGFFGHLRPRKLVMERSEIGWLESGAFEVIGPTLRSLQLKTNIIKKLDASLFVPMQQSLRELDLSFNRIQNFTDTTVGSLQTLRTLSLYKNNLSNIADGAFSALKNLKRLNLGGNELHSLTARTFDGLDSLEYLNLGHNHIAHIHPHAFRNLKKLRFLDLGSNRLTNVKLENLPHLQKLYLNNNSFYALPSLDLSLLPALRVLILDLNKLQKVESRAFTAFQQLQSLSLASNEITQISENSFESLPTLQTLSLQNNRIESIPDAVFEPLTSLRHLFLSQNKLKDLGEREFYGLGNLEVLSVAHNAITSVHRRAFAQLYSLQRLFMNKNQLGNLSNDTVRYIRRKLAVADFSDNPWQCGCQLLEMSLWMKKYQERMVNSAGTKCVGKKLSVVNMAPHLTKSCQSRQAPLKSVDEAHSVWITAIGITLGVVILLMCAAIAILYVQDGRKAVGIRGQGVKPTSPSSNFLAKAAKSRSYDLRRVPSDMVTLIPKCSTVIDKKVRFDLC